MMPPSPLTPTPLPPTPRCPISSPWRKPLLLRAM